MKKFITLSLLVFGSSCTTPSEKFVTNESPKHIIHIGFDGLSAYSLNNNANMPNLRWLMSNGAYTTKCRSILPSSSACNWASTYMGAGSELHGYNTWGSKKPDLPSRVVTKNGTFPDIFFETRAAHPEAKLGFIYEWGGMRYLVDTLALDNNTHTKALVGPTIEYIVNEKPKLLSVVFAEPDGVGHGKGWESKEYMDKLEVLDAQLGEIIAAIDQAGIMDETLIIVSADHGGVNTGHGGISMKEMETPLVLFGKGVKKGYEIDDSVMIYDIASTILSAQHIKQPQVWIGRPIWSAFGNYSSEEVL